MHDDHQKMLICGVLILITLMVVAGQAHADGGTQPGVLATVQEHQIFTQNMVFAIATWFAFVVGAICGFSVARKRNSGGVA